MFEPLADRVLLTLNPPPKDPIGDARGAKVAAVGPEVTRVAQGQDVLIPVDAGYEVAVAGVEGVVVREGEILGLVK